MFDCAINAGKDAARVAQKGAIDFLVVSYNFLDKMDISGGKYKVIIVDESHFIKDGSAKRTKAAMPILKECRRCILLTGTPALNRPKEVWIIGLTFAVTLVNAMCINTGESHVATIFSIASTFFSYVADFHTIGVVAAGGKAENVSFW